MPPDANAQTCADNRSSPPHLAWYGDDFTGASDTLATLAQAGLRARLFLGVPDAAALRAAGPLDAIGIAGSARSMPAAALRVELLPVARFLARCGAPVVHYKVCSTFDSAPDVGSIGAAMAAFHQAGFEEPALILGGQPSLGRYCAFGQLFATVSPGGDVVRIDRHPTMRRHPVTPMNEADLRLHLSCQGVDRVALFDLRDHALAPTARRERLVALVSPPQGPAPQAVLVDVTQEAHLLTVGDWLWGEVPLDGPPARPRLCIGASSVAQALVDQAGLARLACDPPLAPAQGPVLVLAGSLSPRTALQISNAQGYDHLRLDATLVADANDAALARMADTIVASIRRGQNVLAYTAAGPSERVAQTAPPQLARRTGALLRRVLASVPVSRVGVAGGDTSSHAIQALGAQALDWVARVDTGVALCRAVSREPWLDGLEIMLKGGQLGRPDLFETLVRGRSA